MKKFYSLLIAVLVTVAAMAQTTYTWQGADGASWATSTNWNPTRTTPATNDILQFNDGSTKSVTAVPTQTVGRLIVTSNTTVTLEAAAGVTLTLGNVTGTELTIDAGSQFTMGTNVNVTLANNSTSTIAGTLTVNANRTFDSDNTGVVSTVTGTIENSGTVSGTATRLLFSSGGTYIHARDGGAIPTAGWNAASNTEITGITITVPTGLNQAFGNVEWDCTNQTAALSLAGALDDINGNLTVTSTGTGSTYFVNNTGGAVTITIDGDYIQTGGTWVIVNTSGTVNVNLNGNFNMSGGTLSRNGGTANFVFDRAGAQSFTKTGGTISGAVNFRIDNTSIVDFGTSVLDGSTGTFTVDADADLITSNDDGIRSTGAFGSIQVTGTRSYNSGADYEFRGASTGTFTTTPTASTVRNLTINNASGNVTLSQPLAVTGTLALTSGALTTTITNLVTVNAGANTSGTSFVDGPMAKIGNTAFTFPVGKVGAGRHTVGIAAPSASSTIRAEYFRADPHTLGTVGAGFTNISACEYWTLSRTAGTGTGRTILSWETTSPCSGAGYVGNLGTLSVARLNAGIWGNDGVFGLPTGNVNAGTITANLTSNFTASFALASTAADNPLPVMYANVKAFQKNSGVQIEWSNLTERDLLKYEVERSFNGQDFASINMQLPRSNNNDKESYIAYDAAPASSVNFYRIKAYEIGGKIVYSKILKVDLSGKQSLNLYPNPVTGGQLSVSLNTKQGQYAVKILNSAGQQVYAQRLNHQGGMATQTVDISTVKPGVYNILVTGENFRESKMFIVQ
ncbi:MAG: T9SS type A sorting domain-containing protein [Chitinophagaceae bacterium]|nr:T9SS type A sorting domain-containing protein [Chitinophagaceae bacterium]